MNTGLPQLFAFGLIVLMGFVLLISVFFLRSGDAPVTENVDSELANFKAHYLLSGLLNYKVNAPDLEGVFDDPRFSDFIIHYYSSNNELTVFQQVFMTQPEKVRETNQFQGVVRASLNRSFHDAGFLYKFYLNDELISGNVIPPKQSIFDNCELGSSEARLVRKGNDITAKLVICEVAR